VVVFHIAGNLLSLFLLIFVVVVVVVILHFVVAPLRHGSSSSSAIGRGGRRASNPTHDDRSGGLFVRVVVLANDVRRGGWGGRGSRHVRSNGGGGFVVIARNVDVAAVFAFFFIPRSSPHIIILFRLYIYNCINGLSLLCVVENCKNHERVCAVSLRNCIYTRVTKLYIYILVASYRVAILLHYACPPRRKHGDDG
jgi:hypothetical protein